jgi:hypothetical protein
MYPCWIDFANILVKNVVCFGFMSVPSIISSTLLSLPPSMVKGL